MGREVEFHLIPGSWDSEFPFIVRPSARQFKRCTKEIAAQIEVAYCAFVCVDFPVKNE